MALRFSSCNGILYTLGVNGPSLLLSTPYYDNNVQYMYDQTDFLFSDGVVIPRLLKRRSILSPDHFLYPPENGVFFFFSNQLHTWMDGHDFSLPWFPGWG
jgi:hypothetical protein